MTHVAIWIGGAPPVPRALVELPHVDLVIAADSGLDVALDAGVAVDVLVGDLDSVTDQRVEAFDGEVVRFPADKDFTDLELALDCAVQRGASRIMVLGGGGGRLDHELGSLLVLTLEKYEGVAIEARIGSAHVRVVRGRVELTGAVGQIISLIPVTDSVEGVTTVGLRWGLDKATLQRGATWSISNEFALPVASVDVVAGVLLAVQPEAFEPVA